MSQFLLNGVPIGGVLDIPRMDKSDWDNLPVKPPFSILDDVDYHNEPTDNCVYVTADGVKTYKQLLIDLWSQIDFTKITRNAKLTIGTSNSNFTNLVLRYSGANHAYFDCSYLSNTSVVTVDILVHASSAFCHTVNGGPYSDSSSNVVDSGTIFALYYNTVATPGTESEDSGWQTTAAVNGNTIQYRKIRNQVWVRRGTIGTTSAGSWSNIASLPTGYRPSANVSYAIYAESGGSVYGNVQVLSNGNVNSITNLANNVPAFFFSFLVD